MIGIYKITNPDNEIYIGQSVDIEKRFKQHKRKSTNKQLQESIEKYGFENHKFEIIKECRYDELTALESETIIEYRKTNKLFNASDYESFAGRKGIPNGIKKQFVIPKENLQEVTDIVKSFQYAAILKEKINNLKK